MAEPHHSITIRLALEGAGYDVEILPPPEGVGHDREFSVYRDAYGYASGLRLVTGWPIRDLVGERP